MAKTQRTKGKKASPATAKRKKGSGAVSTTKTRTKRAGVSGTRTRRTPKPVVPPEPVMEPEQVTSNVASSHRRSPDPLPGHRVIVSATKIAMRTKNKASRLIHSAGSFFSSQKKNGKAVIQTIAENEKLKRVIDFAGGLPEKMKERRKR